MCIAGCKSTFACNSWLQQSKDNPEALLTLSATEVEGVAATAEAGASSGSQQAHGPQTTDQPHHSSDVNAVAAAAPAPAPAAGASKALHATEVGSRRPEQPPAGSAVLVHQGLAAATVPQGQLRGSDAPKEVVFKITVATSNLPGAGTDASVQLSVSAGYVVLVNVVSWW